MITNKGAVTAKGTFNITYMAPEFKDLVNGITYKRAELTRWQKIKIFFGFMNEPEKIRVEPIPLYDLLPKTKWAKTGWRVKNSKRRTS